MLGFSGFRVRVRISGFPDFRILGIGLGLGLGLVEYDPVTNVFTDLSYPTFLLKITKLHVAFP